MLKIFIERWFWKFNMLIGSLVELHVGLHSRLYFSLLEKLLLKASSTPSRYLAICRASSAFSYRNLDSFSTPGGSIEKVSASSIASRQLVDRSSFDSYIWWFVPRHLLDTCISQKPISWHLHRQMTWHLIYRDLLRVYLYFLMRSDPHFFRSLSQYLSHFSPKQPHLTPILILKVSSSFFNIFFTW